jgi:DNA-binding response OmpR family regulator
MPKKSTPKTVLVLEDDIDLRKFAAWMLESEGFQVIQEADGEAGLELLLQRQIDLLLLDIKLPSRDGWSILEEMRNTPKLSTVPVIIFTASADISNKDRALKMGAADYLVKPLSAEVLKNCVTRILLH